MMVGRLKGIQGNGVFQVPDRLFIIFILIIISAADKIEAVFKWMG